MTEPIYKTVVPEPPEPNHAEVSPEISRTDNAKVLEDVNAKLNALLLANGIDPASIEEASDVQEHRA